MSTILRCTALAVALPGSGCSSGSTAYQTAPITGVVTLDGQPLEGAHVTFMPAPELRSTSESGPESMGDTDAQGRYTLRTVFGDTGASLGKNRVMISTRKIELDPMNPDKSKETAKERVPGRYFTDQAPLTFEVPKGGSQEANFSLTTK